LPIVLTVAFAPFSALDDSIPPALWMVVARLDGGRQARSEPVWSLSLADQPWQRALERAREYAGPVVELLALAAVVAALVRRRWTVVVLAVAALTEVGLYVGMTELGFSGNPRYMVPALALACVLAGVGLASVLRAPPAVALPALGAVLVLGPSSLDGRIVELRAEAREARARMQMHADLARAVDRVGGPAEVTAMGTATTNRAFHSRLAWELKVPIDEVESVTNHRIIFRSLREPQGGRVFFVGRAKFGARSSSWGTGACTAGNGSAFP
jgi:hypothetical protein